MLDFVTTNNNIISYAYPQHKPTMSLLPAANMIKQSNSKICFLKGYTSTA